MKKIRRTSEVASDEDEGGVDEGESGPHKFREIAGTVWMVNAEMKIGKLNHPNHRIWASFDVCNSIIAFSYGNFTQNRNSKKKKKKFDVPSSVVLDSQFHFELFKFSSRNLSAFYALVS